MAVAASGEIVSVRPAVFLDRDGTLVREVDYLRELAQLRLLPGAAGAIRTLNEAGFAVVLLTNQSGLARGYLTEAEFHEIHGELERRLARQGAHLDGMYYCPHLPDATVPEYRCECSCRKPPRVCWCAPRGRWGWIWHTPMRWAIGRAIWRRAEPWVAERCWSCTGYGAREWAAWSEPWGRIG